MLREIVILQKEHELNPHQYLINFQVAETSNSIVLFWPMLFDERAALLHELAGSDYRPTITSLVLVARRSALEQLVVVQPMQGSHMHPRTGCTTLQPWNS